MLIRLAAACRKHGLGMAAAMLAGLAAVPLAAQSIERIDPDAAIDADLTNPGAAPSAPVPAPEAVQPTERYSDPAPRYADATLDLPPESYPAPGTTVAAASPSAASSGGAATTVDPATTYAEDDLIGAAEGLFGKGAEGLARVIQDILAEQGEPNAYIVGREGSGAFIVGVRYGSGTLFHRVEGNKPVYWTGPSIGFDAGANAGNTFVLVYNLDDSEDLYRRYPAGEGQAYLVGGFTASYLRRGNTVLIPIRVGAGLRLGVNAGYMRFSHEQRWLPF